MTGVKTNHTHGDGAETVETAGVGVQSIHVIIGGRGCLQTLPLLQREFAAAPIVVPRIFTTHESSAPRLLL